MAMGFAYLTMGRLERPDPLKLCYKYYNNNVRNEQYCEGGGGVGWGGVLSVMGRILPHSR